MTNYTVWPLSMWQRFEIAGRHPSLDRDLPGFVRGPWYTLNAVLEVRGPFDRRLLDEAFNQLLRRHELLRTRIDEGAREPVQVVSSRVNSRVEILDREDSLSAGALLYAPVEFDAPSPIRLRLAPRSSNEHLVTVHLHHVMADPTTLWMVLRELGALYSGLLSGLVLPNPSAQYGEYAQLEAQLVVAGRSASEQWWSTLLSRATSARTLRDGQIDAGEGVYRSELLTAAELSAVERWARAHRNILFAALVTAMARSVAPYYETAGGLLFTTLFSRRDRPEWQHMLGPCTIPAYLWVPEPPERLSTAYAEAVRDIVFGCYRHARLPDVATLTGISEQEPVYKAYTVPCIEHLPKEWPGRIDFGPARGLVVNAVGPLDAGNRRSLAIRTRKADGGALAARVSWDGNGWTKNLALRVFHDLRGQVNHLIGGREYG
ncbi:Condensation domain-containing protein [Saccharopolyspora antimicrobica]|uniref:Condensation domain-containing protein n=1 Tax=Saccharopolyspora antimicrobica TaxID=455193 RepID=A0A1I4W391_9PSEU|nr:condensation domain-containing protein [Saccharopolyspora antimicrobica]RKT87098.1 condensation domain-containing protein [Saccharopolyspora antimicrobica]SFN07706.1 Condensation domain-containing protein [Saccharopolyspora antimicrobica]